MVIHDILTVSRKPGIATRIMRLANVRYNIFREYVDLLCKSGFIEEKKATEDTSLNKKYYQTTKMGDRWCRMIKTVYEELKSGEEPSSE